MSHHPGQSAGTAGRGTRGLSAGPCRGTPCSVKVPCDAGTITERDPDPCAGQTWPPFVFATPAGMRTRASPTVGIAPELSSRDSLTFESTRCEKAAEYFTAGARLSVDRRSGEGARDRIPIIFDVHLSHKNRAAGRHICSAQLSAAPRPTLRSILIWIELLLTRHHDNERPQCVRRFNRTLACTCSTVGNRPRLHVQALIACRGRARTTTFSLTHSFIIWRVMAPG